MKNILLLLGAICLLCASEYSYAKEKYPHKELSEISTLHNSAVFSMINPQMLARGQKKTLVNFNLIEVDIEKNKFNKKNKVRVGLEFSNRKKYTYTYDKSFKDKYIIGHVPEGYYVVTSMETNRDFDRYSSRKVQCYNNKAPVYHLKSNKNYFLQNINTAPLKSQKAAIGDITSFIYGLLNINITFEPAMPIGYISFEGSDKNMIGNKIKCPKGKKFSFESKNPDTK